MSIEKELKEQVESIAKEINNITYERAGEFLENAIDIQIIKPLAKNEIVGFDVLITFGGPNIRLKCSRGYTELVGTWGNAEYKKEIDKEAAENILEYLNEIYY